MKGVKREWRVLFEWILSFIVRGGNSGGVSAKSLLVAESHTWGALGLEQAEVVIWVLTIRFAFIRLSCSCSATRCS